MTPDAFIAIALALPGTIEASHFGKRDFRCGKIFMSLPEDGRAVVKFTPDQQAMLLDLYPSEIQPLANKWGLHGWTSVIIAACDEQTARMVLETAWQNVAPKKRVAAFLAEQDRAKSSAPPEVPDFPQPDQQD